jgi:hypothetical protein
MTTLEELERLREAATLQPWHFNEDARSINSDHWFAEGASKYRPCIVTLPVWHAAHSYEQKANAALIVAAINALPGLIESARRVERLEEALSRIQSDGVPAEVDDKPEPLALAVAQIMVLRMIAREALGATQ